MKIYFITYVFAKFNFQNILAHAEHIWDHWNSKQFFALGMDSLFCVGLYQGQAGLKGVYELAMWYHLIAQFGRFRWSALKSQTNNLPREFTVITDLQSTTSRVFFLCRNFKTCIFSSRIK